MFEDNGDQVIAHFEDVSYTVGDLLVGCDGGASAVKKLLPLVYGNSLGTIPKVIDLNRAVLGGQIDRTQKWDILLPLNKMGLVRFVGANSYSLSVCFSERADRSPTVFWAFSEDIDDRNACCYMVDQEVEWRKRILEHCKQLMKEGFWHENLKRLVYDTPVEAIMAPWLLRTTQFPDISQFPIIPTGRVTFVGDSIHAMPPDKGLGGNNVLEDARLLSVLLAASPKPIDWSKLIGEYEREMCARTRIAVQESENASQYFRDFRSPS